MIPKRSLLDLTIAALLMATPLTAQGDPLIRCRKRASILINAAIPNTSAQRRGGSANGNEIILWKAKLANGHIVSGFCEASPQTGRIVRLGTDQDSDVNRAYRMTPGDAERICQREARARFSPGNGLINASFLPNTSTESTYRVGWWYGSLAGLVRKGRCEIDSATGSLLKFRATDGW